MNLTTPTWTQELMAAHDAAHDQCARRNNPSTQALIQAAHGNGTFPNAVAAALMTLGGKHGPLQATQELLDRSNSTERAAMMLGDELKVPGWGSSFVKGEHDPVWREVWTLLEVHQPGLQRRIADITKMLHGFGKMVHPNPSCYTAACAIVMGIPAPACPMLFVKARLQAWTEIYLATVQGGA